MKLSDIIACHLGKDSPYVAVFIPGGHGVMIGIPESREVKQVLKWATSNDKFVISLCHGPASLLAAAVDEYPENYIFKDYKICVFPDEIDKASPEIGYMPGQLTWLVGERLRALGVQILNSDITGKCHQDRRLLTGDSPLASNNLGKLAAETLLKEVGV